MQLHTSHCPLRGQTWCRTGHSTAQDHGATVNAGTRRVQWPQVLSVEVKVPPGVGLSWTVWLCTAPPPVLALGAVTFGR